MAQAKVFKSGNGQAVRLPKEFRFKSDRVEIFRRGDEIVLREGEPTLRGVVELLRQLSDDFEVPEDLPVQDREGL